MAADYTRQWIQFFTGCGIPEDIATTYGLIFNENRIQKNMLLDLNKEYLRDMGITVMGDVIAILRHAKVVHDKYARDQILSESEVTVENYEIIDPGVKKRMPVKRILEHYTRKYGTSEPGVPHEKVQIQIENENSVMKIPNELVHIGPQNKVTVKKKIEAPSTMDNSMTIKPVVPVPKVRRVLPENEGSYRIKMPSGTTERSKKILEKAKLKQNKTVFDRLGESSVSSTSDVTTSSSTTTQIVKPSAPKEKNISSVFARLGEKSSLVTSTSSNGDSAIGGEQLCYRGILKTKAGNKLEFLPGSTMRADNELQKSQANDIKIKKINLKERLGISAKTAQSSPPKESMKLNRLQITTTFEDEATETESSQVTLSSRFKSIKPLSREGKKEKYISDCLGNFRSEAVQNKSGESSATQLSDAKLRGVKRRLESSKSAVPETSDVVQSKKVRFGRTTQRLIPGNRTEFKETTKGRPNLTMMIGNETAGSKKLDKLTLTSGVKIGPMNSDNIRQKLSLKDRIGNGSMQLKLGGIAIDLKRKHSLKYSNRLKTNIVSIHDRLG